MKYIIFTLVILAFAVFEADAQYKESYGYVGVRSGRVVLDGKRLSLGEERVFLNDTFGNDIYKEFVRNRRISNAGLSLVVIGGALLTGAVADHWRTTVSLSAYVNLTMNPGFMGFLEPDSSYESYLSMRLKRSGYIMIGGLAMLAAGIPTLCVYRSRMRSCIGEAYAAQHGKEVAVAFGGTPSGIGLTLSF